MTDKATIDERIEEIIELIEKEMDECFYAGIECADVEYGDDNWTAEANPEIKEKIKSLILEVVREAVGKDEVGDFYPLKTSALLGGIEDGLKHDIEVRNQLRKQILEKVRGL
jgi:hypothetical protein